MLVVLEWMEEAEKRGIPHEDVSHAMTEGRLWFVPKFEESRIPGEPDPSLFVGCARDGVTMLEVMVTPREPNTLVVFHVMEARSKHVDLARRKSIARRKEK